MPTETIAIGTTMTPTNTAGDTLDPNIAPDVLLANEGIDAATITSVTVTYEVTSDPGGGWSPYVVTGCYVNGGQVDAAWSSSVSGVEFSNDYYIKASAGPTLLGLFEADGQVTVTCTPPTGTSMVGGDNDYLKVDAYLDGGAGAASADISVVQVAITYTTTGPEAPSDPGADITVQVWNSNNSLKVADLDGTWDRSWQDLANDPGTAGLTIDTDNDNADELTVGRHVRYKFGDDLAFTTLIADGDLERTLAGDGDDAAKVTRVRSRGIAAEWESAVVKPVNGLDGRPQSDIRPFTWASPEMPISSWSTCYTYLGQISRQIELDPPYHEPWYPPRGWPSLDAEWMWPINRGNVYPVTRGLMVRDFVVSTAGPITHFVTGDQRARFFIDGLEALGWIGEWPEQSFVKAFECTVEMSVGTHRLGLEVETYDLSSLGLPARGMGTWCAHRPDGTGVYDDSTLLDVAAASEWKGWDTEQKGFTPAPNPHVILSTLLSEWQADGVLTNWSLSSTATVDSNGQAWDRPVEILPRVGDTGLDVLRMLSEVSIDWRARPAGRVLDIYNKGNRGVTVSAAQIVADDNAYKLERTQ